MKPPDTNSKNPDGPKPERTPSEPFQLEITPEKLVVPPDGTLEVKIFNPEKLACVVEAYLDSFFFLMKASEEECVKNVGDSISTILVQKELKPNETLSLNIGYLNGEYTVKNRYKTICNRGLFDDSSVEKLEVAKATPNERIYYNQDRPEGHLTVSYYKRKESEDDSPRHKIKDEPVCRILVKTIELHLENETEQYKMFREQFEKVKKDQTIRARWGHVLLKEDHITKRKFTSDSGEIRDFNEEGGLGMVLNSAGYEGWNRIIPVKLEEIDRMTDEEIKLFKIHEREAAMKEDAELKKKLFKRDERKAENMKNEKKAEKSKAKIEPKPAVKPPAELKVSEAQKPGLQTVKTAEEKIQKAPEATVPEAQKPSSQKIDTAQSKVQKPTEIPDKKKRESNKKKKKNPCCSVM